MSTNDPIEDLFRENQHGLDEKPRDLIWDRIEERLDERPNISKKKSNGWKYAVAACAVVGISLAGFILINQNYSPDQTVNSTSIALEEVEMTPEAATEILDQLEEKKDQIATTKTHSTAPDIIENEPLEIKSKKMDTPLQELKAVSEPEPSPIYEEAMEISAPAPAMAKESKVQMQDSQQEIIAFRGETPAKKEGNYILRNKEMDARRLGNMAEKSVSYDTIYIETIVKQLTVKISSRTIKYDLVVSTNDSMVYENKKIAYPSKVSLFKTQNNKIEVQFKGNKKKENTTESREIQSFFEKNKIEIFGLGIQID